MRPELAKLAALTVRHHPDSTVAGMLLLGWLASRLGWQMSPMVAHDGALEGNAHADPQDIALRLEPDPKQEVRGLQGLTLRTASGLQLSLDRAPGGLRAHRIRAKDDEQEWTILGASRGESGVLGEGIRQALLRDPTYAPALRAAKAMLP
jgi:hypothetical protein